MGTLKFGSTKGDKIFRKTMFYKVEGDRSGGDMITVEITLGGGHTKEIGATQDYRAVTHELMEEWRDWDVH